MRDKHLENRPIEKVVGGYRIILESLLKQPETETIPMSEALGRITARGCRSQFTNPHFNPYATGRTNVKAADAFVPTEFVPIELNPEKLTVVNIGGPIPTGFDTVLMVEELVFEGKRAVLRDASHAWKHVKKISLRLYREDIILPSHTKLTPAAIGALLVGGVTKIEVLKKVRVGIIPYGNTLSPAGDNVHMLRAALLRAGCDIKRYDIEDTPDSLKEALSRAAAENDMVILNANSLGGRDNDSKKAIEETGGAFAHPIAIRPGNPVVLGIYGHVIAIGLPGYPVSTLTALEQLVFPAIEIMTQNTPSPPDMAAAPLLRRAVPDLKYKDFLQVKLEYVEDKLIATPIDGDGRAISSLVKADGIVTIPFKGDGIDADENVELTLLRPLAKVGTDS